MIIPISSVVTKSCLQEFLITKFSCEQFNTCKWYIACDKYSYEKLSKFENLKLFSFDIDDSISNHNSSNPLERKAFLEIILNKFVAIEKAVEENEYTLFIDSDMLFLSKIEDNILNLLKNKNIDFIVSPHYTNNLSIEDRYGFYNVGMFGVNNVNNILDWKQLTKNHEKLNLYFEQKPFELILKNYISLNLPINYNIGWWRFNQENTKERLKQIKIINEEIYFGTLKTVNFHFHVIKKPNGYDPGGFLVDLILNLMKSTKNEKYQNIIKYYEQISS